MDQPVPANAISIDGRIETVDDRGQAVRNHARVDETNLQAITMIDEHSYPNIAALAIRVRPRASAALAGARE